MTGDSLPKIALRGTSEGNRSKGRAKETWRRTVDMTLNNRAHLGKRNGEGQAFVKSPSEASYSSGT